MWDIKLFYIDFFLLYFNYFILYFFNFFTIILHKGFFFFNIKIYYQFVQNLAFIFGLKFILCIMILILVRGGTPRYRYDYLTKLGWLKFLGFILSAFFFSLFFFFIY